MHSSLTCENDEGEEDVKEDVSAAFNEAVHLMKYAQVNVHLSKW